MSEPYKHGTKCKRDKYIHVPHSVVRTPYIRQESPLRQLVAASHHPKSVIGVRSNVIGQTHDQVKRYVCNRSAIFHPLSPGREGIFVEHQQRKFLCLPLVESTAVRRSRFTVALSTGQSSLPWMLGSFVQGSGLTGWSLASKEIHAGPGCCVLFFEQLDGLFKGPSASSFV